MLKLILSTVCIFLFFDDVRLTKFKCADPNCSVSITTGKVSHRYPPKVKPEVNVSPKDVVEIHGIDTQGKYYLVKTKQSNGFSLLPVNVLKEQSNLKKATIEVEIPFDLVQSQHTPTSIVSERSSLIELLGFKIIDTCPLNGESVLTDPNAESSRAKKSEIKPDEETSPEEAAPVDHNKPSESVEQNKTSSNILAKNATSEPAPSSSETKITQETGDAVSKNTTHDSYVEDSQKNTDDKEQNDEVSVEVEGDGLVENKPEKIENVSKLNNSSESVKNSTSSTDAGSSNASSPTSEQIPEIVRNESSSQTEPPKIEPKVSFGDTTASMASLHLQGNNLTSDGNQSTEVGTNTAHAAESSQSIFPNNSAEDYPNRIVGLENDPSPIINSLVNVARVDTPDISQQNNSEIPGNVSTVSEPDSSNVDVNSTHGTEQKIFKKRVNSSEEKENITEESLPLPPPPISGTLAPSKSEGKSVPSTPDPKIPVFPKTNFAPPGKEESNRANPTVVPPETSVSPGKEESTGEPAEIVSPETPVPSGKVESTGETPKIDSAEIPGSSGKEKSTDAIPAVIPSESFASVEKTVSSSKEEQKARIPEVSQGNASPETSSYPSVGTPPKKILAEPTHPIGVHQDKVPPNTQHEDFSKNSAEAASPTENQKTDADVALTGESGFSNSAKDKVPVPQNPVDPEDDFSAKTKRETDSSSENEPVQEKKDDVVPALGFLGDTQKNSNELAADQLYDAQKDQSRNLENVLPEEPAFYTNVLGYFGKFHSLLDSVLGLQSYLNFEWLQKNDTSVAEQHCQEESCSGFSIFDSMAKYGFDVGAINLQSWSLAELQQSQNARLLLGVFLCTIIFGTLVSLSGSSKKKRISTLISVVNRLEKKLLVACKEISSLETKLSDGPEIEISQVAAEVDFESNDLLLQQIEQLQFQNTDLEDKVTYLEKELHNVTTSAFEMHKLLENSLSTQAQSRVAEDEVDVLRTLTERQERQIDELMREMDAIVIENRYLKDDLRKMEKEFNSQAKKNLELSEKNRNLSLRFDQQVEESATMKSNYKSEIYQLQAKIEDLEISLRRSEFQVETLNKAIMDKFENKSDDQMQALQEDVQLKMNLSTLKAMNNQLSAELKEEKNARRTLDDHIGDVIRECNDLKQALEISEKGRNEAANKLQVLTDYFKEKESQLQKEIAAKEKLFMENENKDQLLSQKLSSLKEEIKNNKDRNEELKKEIEAQERSFKNQLATAEQKSRDLWFALRQAERKYQESEKEAATLRNKILILENNLSSANQKLSEKNSLNGDINGSSSLMYAAEMMYRVPSDLIPPPPSPIASHSPEFFPPEPSYSPDNERLPPLGGRRVPSPTMLIVPPPDDDLKIPPPHAEYMSARSRQESLNMSSYYGDSGPYN